MRSWLNSDYLAKLPSSLSNNIAAVRKATNNQGYLDSDDSSVVTQTTDKLWLFSISELLGVLSAQSYHTPSYPATYDAEGLQYQLYVDQGVTTSNYYFCAKGGHDISVCWWWLRSPHPDYTSFFYGLDGGGYWSYTNASYGMGYVSPGFCF